MLRIAAVAVALVATSYVMLGALAGEDKAGTGQLADAGMLNAAVTTQGAASPDITELRSDYAACLRKSVKRYNDGLRESDLVAEMTTHACTPTLYEIRWKLLAAGTPESEATAYAAKLQVRARNKLAEMVENGF